MPVSLSSNLPGDAKSCTKGLCANPSAGCLDRLSKTLNIGLVNNMANGALEATERQFLSLLESASEGFSVNLSLYSLPGVPRSEAGERHIQAFYSSTESLWDKSLDGLIVTGREPLTSNLRDEPYWENFTKIVDWARDNTHSTIWSCLAAHAAVLHLDDVSRIRNQHKHSGIFDCEQLSDHALTLGAPSHFKLPHSRWNGLSEDELTACGYNVLTRSADIGVDTFVKQQKSLFVFFQGHPEYESNTLLLEYRRDVGRYLRGESETYPLMPRSYFDAQTEEALNALREQALSNRREELLEEVSTVVTGASIENTWRPTAACIYRNWLKHMAARKKSLLKSSTVESITPSIAGSNAIVSIGAELVARA
jgi:homoserine O-succinyltransferase/O-acetyltransferase